jgi:hypothetical protein
VRLLLLLLLPDYCCEERGRILSGAVRGAAACVSCWEKLIRAEVGRGIQGYRPHRGCRPACIKLLGCCWTSSLAQRLHCTIAALWPQIS